MERVEQCIPNPIRCYKCQKYVQYENNCKKKSVWEMRFTRIWTSRQWMWTSTQMCQSYRWPSGLRKNWKLEKEILAIKHKNNINYYEARKMVPSPYLFSGCPTWKNSTCPGPQIWTNCQKYNSASTKWQWKFLLWNKSLTWILQRWYHQSCRSTKDLKLKPVLKIRNL